MLLKHGHKQNKKKICDNRSTWERRILFSLARDSMICRFTDGNMIASNVFYRTGAITYQLPNNFHIQNFSSGWVQVYKTN